MSHIFISYAHADQEFVNELVQRLRNAGISVWKDSHDLHAGDDWRERIDDAIKAATALIVVMTPAAADSEYVSYEWACGLGADVRVLPVLVERSELHPRLSAMHYLDFTTPSDRPWDRLIQELQKAAAISPKISVEIPSNTIPMVRKALEALDSLNADEQMQAVQALTRIDHPSARDGLAIAAQHPTRDVRIRASLELARFKDPRAVPGLIESQRSWQLRYEFVRNITPIGLAAVPGLIGALRDPNTELRRYAAIALGEICHEAAVPALVQALKDSDADVRGAASAALDKIGATRSADSSAKLNPHN
jgi:hypothetical protein